MPTMVACDGGVWFLFAPWIHRWEADAGSWEFEQEELASWLWPGVCNILGVTSGGATAWSLVIAMRS